MVKVIKKHASGGQGINPLDPKYVTVTDRWSVTVTIKTCLATFPKGWLPAGLLEVSFHRTASGGEGGEATSAKIPRKRLTAALYLSFLEANHSGILMKSVYLFFARALSC